MARGKRKLISLLMPLVCVGLGSMVAPSLVAGELGVRVHDAVGEPGGTIAIVLRTYASRPIGQGEVCLQADPMLPFQPPSWAAFNSSWIFSEVPDVESEVTVELLAQPQILDDVFSSLSATVNAADGPLAVYYFRLRDDVRPGDRYELALDVGGTWFDDENGDPIPIRPRAGELRIREHGAPMDVAARAEDTVPGEVALLSFETYEPILLSSGRVAIRYDPAIADGLPEVVMNPRHGDSTHQSDVSTPGLVVVEFRSSDASLNRVPGDLIEILLPTSPSVPPGTRSPIQVDPTLTTLFDASGQTLSLALDDDVLEFDAPAASLPGAISGLEVQRVDGDRLELTWSADCGSATEYAVYRGDLAQGYDSLAPEPGQCSVSGTGAVIPEGTGTADFFLVVPHVDGVEGSYGIGAGGERRPSADSTCHATGSVDACAP